MKVFCALFLITLVATGKIAGCKCIGAYEEFKRRVGHYLGISDGNDLTTSDFQNVAEQMEKICSQYQYAPGNIKKITDQEAAALVDKELRNSQKCLKFCKKSLCEKADEQDSEKENRQKYCCKICFHSAHTENRMKCGEKVNWECKVSEIKKRLQKCRAEGKAGETSLLHPGPHSYVLFHPTPSITVSPLSQKLSAITIGRELQTVITTPEENKTQRTTVRKPETQQAVTTSTSKVSHMPEHPTASHANSTIAEMTISATPVMTAGIQCQLTTNGPEKTEDVKEQSVLLKGCLIVCKALYKICVDVEDTINRFPRKCTSLMILICDRSKSEYYNCLLKSIEFASNICPVLSPEDVLPIKQCSECISSCSGGNWFNPGERSSSSHDHDTERSSIRNTTVPNVEIVQTHLSLSAASENRTEQPTSPFQNQYTMWTITDSKSVDTPTANTNDMSTTSNVSGNISTGTNTIICQSNSLPDRFTACKMVCIVVHGLCGIDSTKSLSPACGNWLHSYCKVESEVYFACLMKYIKLSFGLCPTEDSDFGKSIAKCENCIQQCMNKELMTPEGNGDMICENHCKKLHSYYEMSRKQQKDRLGKLEKECKKCTRDECVGNVRLRKGCYYQAITETCKDACKDIYACDYCF